MSEKNRGCNFRDDLSKAISRIAKQYGVAREDVLREALRMVDKGFGKEMFTVSELSKRWGCHPNTVYKYLRSGKLRSVKGFYGHRVRSDEVRRFERWRGGFDE